MQEGQLFEGKYKILGIIGRGGMGTVYLGENIKLGTLWAIKEIRKKTSTRIDALVETNILKMLHHPALPRIFDVIEDEEYVYVIVDYIEGTSLDKELARVGKFTEKTVIGWARQICNVFIYLHSFKPNPIIYRDMKPSNIILTGDGSINLIDFGIAREYKVGVGSDTMYIGTRGYAAPEQYGAGQTNVTTDLYSLGVTLYSLVTGKSPNEPPFEIKPLRYYDKSISREFENIVTRCTRLDPAERYRSAVELLADLGKAAGKDCDAEPDAVTTSEPENGENSSRNTSSFKRLVLAVWGNGEFACELAYMAARMSGLKVLLANLDFISYRAGTYLNLQDEFDEMFRQRSGLFGLKAVFGDMERGRLDFEAFEGECLKRRDLKNLHLLSGMPELDDYEACCGMDIPRLIEYAYGKYDVTVLILNKSVFDTAAISSLKMADFVIIPIHAGLDSIREYETYIRFVQSKHGIQTDKMKLVAYEYKKGINLPEKYLKNVISKRAYIGHISYCREREVYRNIDSFFVKWIFKKDPKEYADILSRFNILPRKTLMDKMRCWFGYMSGKTCKPERHVLESAVSGTVKHKV